MPIPDEIIVVTTQPRHGKPQPVIGRFICTDGNNRSLAWIRTLSGRNTLLGKPVENIEVIQLPLPIGAPELAEPIICIVKKERRSICLQQQSMSR